MKLSSYQEEQLIMKYMPLLMKMVNKFCASADFRQRHRDDLEQEAKIAFLAHLRRMNSIDEIYLCRKPILRAMYNFMETTAPVHIPHNVFYDEISNIAVIPMNNEQEKEFYMPSTPSNETNSVCEVNDFLDTLDPREQMLLRLREDGYSNREIVHILNYSSEWQVGRRVKAIQRQYARYAM